MAVFTIKNEVVEKTNKPVQRIDKPVVIDEFIEGNRYWVVEADGTRHILGIPKFKLKALKEYAFTAHWEEKDDGNEFVIDKRWEI